MMRTISRVKEHYLVSGKTLAGKWLASAYATKKEAKQTEKRLLASGQYTEVVIQREIERVTFP